ncbi:hypothetical protein HPB48_025275 [Haemaphysalis longicornis]|uniref:Uncharacterized protein n=1 Tax=Haemaphysalis longicornis TaxID=44386 RepID=A0A9J6H8L2_HAELO|nr:hypothetical protein HPB48_025275 [Haemaphysalis longicornis]
MPTPDDTARWRTVYRSRRRSAELPTVVFRPSNLSLKACKPIAISQAIAAAAHLTPSELQDTLLQPQPDKNIISVSTFRMSALTKLRGLQSLRIQDTDIPLRAYLGAPTDSCRGVIHGVQANTPPEELAANLISTGASIISARMMGRTETALITFAGSTIPGYVIYHHTDFRCYPQKPKAQFCSPCHNIGHRVDVCPLPPSTVLCPTCSRDITGLAADQEHDCVPKCHLCQGAHASTSPKCPTRMDADAQSARRAYQRRLANRRSQRPALDMTSSDTQYRRHRSSSRRRQRSQSRHRQRPQSQQRHASRFHRQNRSPSPHRRVTTSQHVRLRLPGHTQAQQGEVSQQPSVGAPTDPAHPPATPITSSLTYRNALAPPGPSNSPTLPLPPTAPQTIPELYALMVNLFSHLDHRLATIEEAVDHRPRRKRAPPSKNSPPPPCSRDVSFTSDTEDQL